MEFFIYFVVALARALQILMFGRAIFSWFPQFRDSVVSNFLVAMTEPVIMPARLLLGKLEFVRRTPIDIPFFATFILLSFIV